MYPHQIKLAIFDNDGTLVDSEAAYTKAHFLTTGHQLQWALKVRLMGKTLVEAARISIEHYGLDETPEHYAERYEKILASQLENLDLMPGAMEIICELKRRGVKTCIATASSEASFRTKVKSHPEMIEMMDHCFTGDSVKRGKPAPDLFLAALNAYDGIRPEEALVFEDSPLGIKAANNAGIPAIYVPDSNLDPEQSLKEVDAKALMTITSLEKFEFDKFLWGNDDN